MHQNMCFHFLTAGSFFSNYRTVHTEEVKFEHFYEFLLREAGMEEGYDHYMEHFPCVSYL